MAKFKKPNKPQTPSASFVPSNNAGGRGQNPPHRTPSQQHPGSTTGPGGSGGRGQGGRRGTPTAEWIPNASPGGGGGGGGGAPANPPGPPAPPLLPSSEAQRQAADAAYNLSTAHAGGDIYQAALAYGDPTIMARYGAVVDNPNSALSQIGRAEGLAHNELGNQRNDAGLYFSGQHLTDQGRITDEANFNRLAAQQQFQQALNNYYEALAAAQAERDAQYGQATAAEIEAFEQTTPTPQSEGDGKPPKKNRHRNNNRGGRNN